MGPAFCLPGKLCSTPFPTWQTSDMVPMMGESSAFSHRGASRQAWLRARARNAVHRPVFIGAVGIGAFIAVLVSLVVTPLQARRSGSVPTAARSPRPDTTVFASAAARARGRLAAAESALAGARSAAAAMRATRPSAPPAATTSQRDSLSSSAGNLDALLTRIETAPIAASYRALAQSPPLAAMPRLKMLLDSLDELEREREAYGLPGGGQAEAATLAARVSEVGQTIESMGRAKRDSLRQLATALGGEQPFNQPAPITDTVGWVAERDSARSIVVETRTALDNARRRASDYDQDLARAHVSAQANAPPVALLGAALVLGIVLGFGAAFVGEMRHPRISDEHEVERATGVRVLATAQRRARDPSRDRRLADRVAPPLFDPRAPSYQLAYLHVVRAGATRLSLTITGADTSIAAVVAMNVAAIAADEARSTILIDTDAQLLPVAAALRCHAEPGMADVLRARIDWAEVTTQTMAGRDRTIDVIPSGFATAPLDTQALANLFRQEATRLARHYEAIVVVATLEQAAGGLAGALPVPDVIVCARIGYTRLDELREALEAVRRGGGNPLGVVLWDSVPPPPLSADGVGTGARPRQTGETHTLTRQR